MPGLQTSSRRIVCNAENFSIDERWLFRQSLPTESKVTLEISPALATQEREMIEVALRETGGQCPDRPERLPSWEFIDPPWNPRSRH